MSPSGDSQEKEDVANVEESKSCTKTIKYFFNCLKYKKLQI